MEITLYNQEANNIGKIELNDSVFGLEMNNDLIYQAAVAQMANKRCPIAHTKTRGEVRGGGKKPWKQKGTGRARHGSIRSPLWVGGGVTFGPRNDRNFKKNINIKARRKALLVALSDKARTNSILAVDKIDVKDIKTKALDGMLKNFLGAVEQPMKKENKLIMVVNQGSDDKMYKSVRNIPYAEICAVDNINVVDVLKYKYILMTKEAIEKLNNK